MHDRFRPVLCFLLATSLWATAPILGDDLNPPNYRGGPLSTSAEWDFLTVQPIDNIQPDGTTVPLMIGDAAPLLNAAFPVGSPHPSGATFGDIEWTGSSNGGYRGGPKGDGGLVFNVPNWIDTEPEKRLRLQVTYRGGPPPTAVIGFLGVPGSSEDVREALARRVPDDDPSLPNQSDYYYEDWLLYPNPDWEQVVVFVPTGTFVDQVVIDTISGPLTGPILICADGFESGDVSRWTMSVP